MSTVLAVLTAAGSGSRLGADRPKALVPVAGRSLVARAVEGLLASGSVAQIVVTAPEEYLPRFEEELAAFGDRVRIVAGSPSSRQASVARGLRAGLDACPEASVVLIHDAARALTPPAVINRVIEAVRAGHRAVVPALPVTDTIKEISDAEPQLPGQAAVPATPSPSSAASAGAASAVSGEVLAAGEPLALPSTAAEELPQQAPAVEAVIGTPDRSRLRAVQTPQGFDRDTILRAHEFGAQRADDERVAAPDDAALVEAMGESVVLVAGDSLSFKVTTPMDLALAEYLLAQN